MSIQPNLHTVEIISACKHDVCLVRVLLMVAEPQQNEHCAQSLDNLYYFGLILLFRPEVPNLFDPMGRTAALTFLTDQQEWGLIQQALYKY